MKEGNDLGRSRLETYLDILRVLEHIGTLNLSHIMYETDFNLHALKGHLDFLKKQNLVEEQTFAKKRAATQLRKEA